MCAWPWRSRWRDRRSDPFDRTRTGGTDPHLNRGTAEETLQDWAAAEADYLWILERDATDASALYNLGNVRGSTGDWDSARRLYEAAADARPGFAMARSSAALAAWQQQDLSEAEAELRKLIRRYPLFADARAALSACCGNRVHPAKRKVTGPRLLGSISATDSSTGCLRSAAGRPSPQLI